MFNNYKFKDLNLRLIISIIALTVLGIFIIGSANEYNQSRQIIGLILGIIVMFVMCFVDYEFIVRFHWIIYAAVQILLILVLIFGEDVGGARRWIEFGIRFQPSELGKILLILFFASFFAEKEDEINNPVNIIKIAVLAALPLALIEKEPDLSTTIVTTLIICTMLFVAGISYKLVAIAIGTVIPGILLLLFAISQDGQSILDEYQGMRILAWLKPEKYPASAYQQQNSIMAIGSGQIFGKGLYNDSFNSVKNGNYISEPHTDFIFAVFASNFGFVGVLVLLTIIIYFDINIIRLARRKIYDTDKYILTGIVSMLLFQQIQNIGMTIGLLPITGITLPFISYGGSSLLSYMIMIGIILNISMEKNKKYWSK